MQRTDGPTVKLREDRLREHAGRLGIKTDSALAAHLGVSQTTVSRMLSGAIAAGETSIAATLTAFPELSFEELFEVVQSAPGDAA